MWSETSTVISDIGSVYWLELGVSCCLLLPMCKMGVSVMVLYGGLWCARVCPWYGNFFLGKGCWDGLGLV